MKKGRIEKEQKPFHGLNRSLRLSLIVLVLSFCLCQPRAAVACETTVVAAPLLVLLASTDVMNMNFFMTQETSFAWNIMSAAFVSLSKAQLLFATNVELALNNFNNQLINAAGDSTIGLRAMTMELHVAQVDQTYRLGKLQDAQLMTEEQSRKENLINDAQTRYAPSELACEINSTGPGLNRAYQISRALNRTLALDDEPRRENAINTWPTICDSNIRYAGGYTCTGDNWTTLPTTSFNGTGQDIENAWLEYQNLFCDPTMGDVGCASSTAPGLDAGKHKDIGYFLWGPQQTIDPTIPENIREMQATLRYLVDPLAPDTIPETVVPHPGTAVDSLAVQGERATLERHAEMAYVNAIYNVFGGMLSERIGGSGVDVTLMRVGLRGPNNPKGVAAAANDPTDAKYLGDGIPLADASTNASYREISEAMTRDRFNNPKYLVEMLSNPEQVARERNALNALRLQTMNDIYRRQEELLFMEAAEYGRDLNSQIPNAETGRMPLSQP